MSYRWAPYVPVAERRETAAREMRKLAKKGKKIEPIVIEGRKIAKTFWGKSWCTQMETYSDFENRLPRGRTLARNGSVCHLSVTSGCVDAIVSGSELYDVTVSVKEVSKPKWENIKKQCMGGIHSMMDLLQGQLSAGVMDVVCDPKGGLFPEIKDLSLDCSCPDWAVMCKHVAAVLYGIGARLDHRPDDLFLLRGVDHAELVDLSVMVNATQGVEGRHQRIKEDELSDLFGVDVE